MVDLTDPLETIVSILKNSSTGLGTTGYEITDDDASGLTITDGEILVSYTMSKDELKAAFGGTQDYDVIITVKRGEVEDTWIGLSTKVWKVPIIITINVIDKWSAVATKYITAPLVLYKAINALRKFIKAKTSSPGGSINVWKALTWKEEKDTGTKPIIHRCICTSEALLYYNPNPAGVGNTLTTTLNSIRDDEADSNLGTITENSTVHNLPDTVIKEYGARVQVTYTVVGYDEFGSWSVSGLVVVEDSSANPTYMRVNGAGTLTAVYTATWVEVDVEADRIQMVDSSIDHKAYKNEDTYVYRDYGVDHFGDFEHLVDWRSDCHDGPSNGVVWSLQNNIDDFYGLLAAGKTGICVWVNATSGNPRLYLTEYYNYSGYQTYTSSVSANIWYYLRIKKVGTALTCRIWTDSDDRDSNDTEAGSYVGELSLILHADHSFRYVFRCNTMNTGTNYYMNVDIANLDLQE